jgi:hypothetical protein
LTTYVVNLCKEPYDIYIGRPGKGKNKEEGKWGNPFEIGRDGTREEVIAKYTEYILNKPELLEQIPLELKGKTLGCFCKPLACHGDVLAYIADADNR